MRILVTGGSGFVGLNLTKRLIEDGHEVIIVSTGSEPKIDGVSKILYMGLDGIDYNYLSNIDVLFHQMANNDTRCNDKTEMTRANVKGPINLFKTVLNRGCRQFVYASSTAVYGASPAPYIEGVTAEKPLNVYGESKLEFDEFAKSFGQRNGVSVIGLRYCNVYGPGESRKGKRMSMIGQVIRSIMADQQPVLFKDGEQKRDWVHVSDIVSMNLLAMNYKCPEEGQIFNAGSGVATKFNDIIGRINHVLHKNIPIKYIDCPFKDEYQDFTQCDITKAKNQLGFSPKVDIHRGIETYIHHLVKGGD